ncbi:MAG: hypothetical protein AB1791_15290 [Chloroflexota bacterium]
MVLNQLLQSDDVLPLVAEYYLVPDRFSVQQFLDTHPQLGSFLLEARPVIEQIFGPFPQVVLEVETDPEIPGWMQLVAYIRTALPVIEAVERLRQLDEAWFLDQLPRLGLSFNFSLECV